MTSQTEIEPTPQDDNYLGIISAGFGATADTAIEIITGLNEAA